MTKDEIQLECLEAITKSKTGTAALGTGVGKTKLGLMYIHHLFDETIRKILIVAPKRAIFKEWTSQAEQYGYDHFINLIEFTTYLSLSKKNPKDYDIVILDENHSLLSSHEDFLSNYNHYLLGLTGTPPVNEYNEKFKLIDKYCPIRYSYFVDQAVEDNLLNDYRIIVHVLELGKQKNVEVKLKNKPSFYTSEVDNYNYWSARLAHSSNAKERQINSIMRMKALMTYPSKEVYATKLIQHITKTEDKVLIFANTQEQADKLSPYSYHSKNPNSENNLDLFMAGSIKELSCVMQLSEGKNIPNLRQSLILHAYGNERKSQQRIGRTLRLNPSETATIHILCYKNTVDETWVASSLEQLNSDKVIWKNFNINLS
jgi:superfamily II DNA or RNA helicase